MPIDHHWMLAAGSLLAVMLASGALMAALARRSVQFRLRVQYSKPPVRKVPIFELLCAAGAAILTAAVLNQLVVDEPLAVRLSFAAAVPAVLLAALCWVWITVRNQVHQFDEARIHSRGKAIEACGQIREAADAPAIHAAACAALSRGLGATDVRLYLREDRVFPLAYSTTGRDAGPRDYSAGALLVGSLSQLPSPRPFEFENDGPQLAVPFAAGLSLDGFFLVDGGPYSEAQLYFAHEVGRETARALAVATHLQKQVEIRAAGLLERREVDHTRRALQHLVPPDQPAIPGIDYTIDSWRGDKPGGQFIDVLALPKGALGVVAADLGGFGLETAARMAQLQTLVRSRSWAYADDLPELYQSTERALLGVRPAPGPVRIFLACYRPATRTVTYVNAGALAPLLLRRGGEGAQVLRLTQTAPPLLAQGTEPIEVADLVLESGDLLAAFSPGVSDALSPSSERWGDTRFIETLLNWESRGAADLASLVLRAIAEHTAHQLSAHDRILFLMKVS